VTIVFRLPSSAAERVAFSYSPAMEAVLSLHVLVEPKHHPVQHEWVRAMRRLSPALKRAVDGFAFAYRAYFPEFFFPPASGELADFESELRRLRGVDEQLVRLEFAIPLLGAQAAGEEIARDPAALQAPGTRRRLRQRAAGLLERHRDGYYVLYRIVPGQVAALAPSLEAFLERQAPGD